jgi:hypothetical protein
MLSSLENLQLIAELELRHDEVLRQLAELDARIEAVLADVPSAVLPVAPAQESPRVAA